MYDFVVYRLPYQALPVIEACIIAEREFDVRYDEVLRMFIDCHRKNNALHSSTVLIHTAVVHNRTISHRKNKVRSWNKGTYVHGTRLAPE